MTDINGPGGAPKIDISPKVDITIGGLVFKTGELFKIGDVTINLFSRSASKPKSTDRESYGPTVKLEHQRLRTKRATTRQPKSLIVDGTPRTIIYLDAEEDEFSRSSGMGNIDINPDQQTQREPDVGHPDNEHAYILKRGGTTIKVSERRGIFPQLREGEIVCTLVDVIRSEIPDEKYVLLFTERGPPAESLAIPIEGNRTFYLTWPIEKLGDGTYGVVYRVHDTQKDFALKILYERQFMTRTGLINISKEALNSFCSNDSLVDQEETDVRSSVHFTDLMIGLIDNIERRLDSTHQNSNEIFIKAKEDLMGILNSSDQSTNLARQRFDHERFVTRRIFRSLASQSSDNERPRRTARGSSVPSHYVEVVASTETFTQTSAFKTLRKQFNSSDRGDILNLSNYAIVTDYCSSTLKDLLEKEWKLVEVEGTKQVVPSELGAEEGQPDGPRQSSLIGYGLIKCLPYEHRAKVCLPFLLGVAKGLATLRKANMLHHDIKPGNVFVQVDQNWFDVLLGDFSFVAQAAAQGSTEAVLRDVVNTGTPHFRSPEQRDFSEVYQALVLHECEFDGQVRFGLRIIDPKFERSISSKHDRVVFSADKTGFLYTIDFIDRPKSGHDAIIVLSAKDDELRAKFQESESYTQIYIYKIPSVRSDIFGFGALTYDLISGGRSAERFYELVRSIDYSRDDRTLADVINDYRRFREKGDKSIIPGALEEIFLRVTVEDQNDGCNPELLQLILKCMAMNIDGSIVKDAGETVSNDHFNPFVGLVRELEGMGGETYGNNMLLDPMKSAQGSILVERWATQNSNEYVHVKSSDKITKRRWFPS